MIPEHIRDRILSRVSLVDVMEQHGVRLQRRGRQYVGLCPFHQEKTPSFYVNNEEGVYYCFGCHAKGNAITFLREYKSLSFVEAMEYLAALVQEDIKPYLGTDQAREEKRQVYVAMYQKAIEFYQQVLWSAEGEAVREYLLSRGLREETIKAFRLGYSPGVKGIADALKRHGFEYASMVRYGLLSSYDQKDRFAGRIIFPIYDRDGSPIAFGGRVFKDQEGPKYLNSPDTPYFKKSDVLYGLFQAKPTLIKEKQAIVVEGYMDVIGLHQAGITSAVAPLGTSLTESQLQLLQRYVDKILLLFDGDNAGLQAASRSVDLIVESGLEGKVLLLPEGMDPDEMILQQGKEAFMVFTEQEAMEAIDFKWMYVRKYQLKNEPQKKQIEEMFSLIARMKSPMSQSHAISRLASMLRVTPDLLYEDFRGFLRKKEGGQKRTAPQAPLMALQQARMVEEHERMFLATLFLVKDATLLEVIPDMISPEMFQNEQYRQWYVYFLEHKPSLSVMYELVQGDDLLMQKLFSDEEITLERVMEAVYLFQEHYCKRKSQECTMQIQQAEQQNLDPGAIKKLQEEKMQWQQRLQETQLALKDLYNRVEWYFQIEGGKRDGF